MDVKPLGCGLVRSKRSVFPLALPPFLLKLPDGYRATLRVRRLPTVALKAILSTQSKLRKRRFRPDPPTPLRRRGHVCLGRKGLSNGERHGCLKLDVRCLLALPSGDDLALARDSDRAIRGCVPPKNSIFRGFSARTCPRLTRLPTRFGGHEGCSLG